MSDSRSTLRNVWGYTRFPRRYIRTLFFFAWLVTFGLFEKRSREIVSEFSKEPPSPWLGWLGRKKRKAAASDAPASPSIPVMPLSEVLGESADYVVLEPQSHEWNAPLLDVLILGRLTQRYRPEALFEIGTFDGRTSLNLIANAPETARLVTVDIQKRVCRFEQTPFASRITRQIGDSRVLDLTSYYGKMDLIFVDADHDYKSVRHDTELALKLLKPGGGVILWHDYGPGCPGVTQALNEFFAQDPRFATARVVEDSTLVVLEVKEN